MAVTFDDALRQLTAGVAADARAMIATGTTPPPVYEKRKCANCSLVDLCQPRRLARAQSASAWLDRQIAEG